MKLVEFTEYSGNTIYINPELVSAVEHIDSSRTWIALSNNCFGVTGSLSEVMEKLGQKITQ